MNPKDIPAFPTTQYEHGGETDGMTLRDYFAAKALCGLVSDPDLVIGPTQVAELSYKYADAMLEARK